MARVEINETVDRVNAGVLTPGTGYKAFVYQRGTTTQVPVYTTETGTTLVTQPITVDTFGRIDGWVEEGSYDLAVKNAALTTTLYTQASEAIAGSSGAGVFNVKGRYGAKGDGTTDDTAAIQAAIDAADKYNGGDPTLGSSYGSPRGGVVFFPAGTYRVTQSLYTDARIRLVGVQGYAAGGVTSVIRADTGGTYTNGPFSEKWLLKVGRRATGGYWWHSGTLENLALDCNQTAGLGGFHCWGAGENSLIDRVAIVNSGWTDRTLTDIAYTAGSKTITSAAGAFTQDDVTGRFTPIDTAGFPSSWADKHITDGVRTKGSAVLTSATGGFTTAHVGAQVTWGNDTGNSSGEAVFVVSRDSATQVTLSETWRGATTSTADIWLRQPMGLRIESVTNATTAVLTRPAVTTGTSGDATVRRPRPCVRFEPGGATTRIGSLNVSGTSGPGVEFIGSAGAHEIQSLTGDNGGCRLRIRNAGAAGDPCSYVVGLKSENNSYGSTDLDIMADDDPVVLIDGCGMVHVDLKGHAAAGLRGTRTVVRIDRNAGASAGYPSVTCDIGGANPYNPDFEWILLDTGTGRGVRTPHISDGAPFYPRVYWNRSIVSGGNYSNVTNLSGAIGYPVTR